MMITKRSIMMVVTASLMSMLTGTFAKSPSNGIEERFQSRVYRGDNHFSLPYRLLVPTRPETGNNYPLILFLHGSDERGRDNKKQLFVGLDIFADQDKMKRYPCFILAPQCPEEKMWADVDWKSDCHTMKEEPTPALMAALNLVKLLINEYPIDVDSIYVTGYSMGGFGAWEAVQRWPDFFAAAVPVCGGGDESAAQRIAHVPLWAFHGARDTIVKVSRTRRMIHAVVRSGGIPRYTEYPHSNHFSWGIAYGDEELFKWLFRQKRGRLFY